MHLSLRPILLLLVLSCHSLSAPAPGAGGPQVAETRRGLVVAAERLAAEEGAAVLRRGGNAVDAAVVTALALAVTYPCAGNIGGGGFMMIRQADGEAVALDFRETAPGASTRTLYLDAAGEVIPDASTIGFRAVAVPGTVAGLARALERFGSGSVSWADAVTPAWRLASEGFTVTPEFAAELRATRELLERNAAARRIFLRDGRLYEAGETFVQPDLAATLARLRDEGPREFYTGRTATLIAEDMEKHGGLVTRQDLAGYRPAERAPVRGTYRGYEILAMPPPGSGGVALLQMLTMLEPRDIAALKPASVEKIHLFAEVMRRAYADRAEFAGDPDFNDIPVRALLRRDYLERRLADFDPERATPSSRVGGGPLPPPESTETTHFSVLDADGNAVSCTYTINGLYGSGAVAEGTGILLNNEMDDFTSKPGTPNAYGLIQGEANSIGPGRRPLSSMTPVIVVREGRVRIVTGSPGGSTIINTVLEVVTNLIDHGMTPAEAVAAPRFNHQWMPDAISHEAGLAPPEVLAALRAKGHTLRMRRLYANDVAPAASTQGSAETIVVDPETGLRTGVADGRRPGGAAVAE
ncbi:gamma-glutamyltranspeptidase [Opitutaceae bacterium TAV1]|nr:gamma-glutamyltranspeptidase [Opitutaceae bacterium TAV1]